MSEKTYLTILRWGIYLTLITPLLVFRSLLFPFITSKAFYFRIIIELLGAVYLLFIYQYPKYIPRKNALIAAVLIFSGIFILTSFTGIDFNLSFWSDIERMEGAFGFLHLAAYFIIITAVFRSKDDWKKLLHAFWAVCIALGLYGLGQKIGMNGLLLAGDPRISSTLGNSAYLGGISLFAVFLSLMFFVKAKNGFAKIGYALVLIFNLVILLFTGTRGAYLGFASGIAIGLFLYAVLSTNKKLKMVSAAILCFCILSGALLILNSESPAVKGNQYFYRLSHVSFEDATLNTRLISWKAGLRGFLEMPIFGTGSGNYAYFFDKYFPPVFYSYTSSQTYFDHAHNTLVDITATMGILGILSYLAIWAIIIGYLILNFKEKNIDINEFVILAGLLAAYFIQNIFVFDSLATFIAFFIFSGYIAYPAYNRSIEKIERTDNLKRKFNPILAGLLFAASSFLIINYNLIPAKAMIESVRGQYEIMGNKDLAVGYELYKQSLSHNTAFDRDIRSSFINVIISNGYAFYKSDQGKFLNVLDFAISLGEKNLDLNNEDAMMNLQMGQLYNLKGQMTESGFDISRGEFYLRKALASSPGRLQVHFLLAQNRLLAGDKDEAIKILEEAKSLNSDYSECYTNLSRAYLYLGDYEKAYDLVVEAIVGKIGGFGEKSIYEAVSYFTQKKEYDKLEVLYEWLLEREPQNALMMARLAAVYANLGKIEEARETVNAAVELDSGLEEDGERFLESLK